MTEVIKGIKYPLILKLFVIFLFFLPLRFFEIPGTVIGFSLNVARLLSLLVVLALFMSVSLDINFFSRFFRSGTYRNPYVMALFAYFLFSIGYYYTLVLLGKTALFADHDSFFRSWRGRPFAQLAVFLTYGVIPLVVTMYYAQIPRFRKFIERAFVAATLLILYYGYIQQIFYQAGLPVTRRTLTDGFASPLALGPNDFMLRFYSLAGEPRDFGTFMIGALMFYWYTRSERMTRFTKFNLMLMLIASLFTASTSTAVAASISLIVIFIDALWNHRIRIKAVYVKYGIVSLFAVLIMVYAGAVAIFGNQPIRDFLNISSDLTTNKDPSARTVGQAHDLVLPYYIKETFVNSKLYLLFGSGYSHFMNPTVVRILENRFARTDVDDMVSFADTRSYMNKIVIETGLVGTILYLAVFFYTLRLSNKLLIFFKKMKNKQEYHKALLLRITFIIFFVSGAIQISFYYFIIMGLIIGKLNGSMRRNHAVV